MINGKYVSAVIVAAGASERMGTDKLFYDLCGIPCVARTLIAFERSLLIDEIIVSAREGSEERIREICDKYTITKLSAVVPGGSCRQESAANGFYVVNKQCAYIAVHDGARPLITPEEIDLTVASAYKHGAACAAVPLKDTVKITDGDGYIISTPNRSMYVAASTPQIFGTDIYTAALDRYKESLSAFTDDSGMVEAAGYRVKTVICGYRNIKITTPEDIAAAESFIRTCKEPGT